MPTLAPTPTPTPSLEPSAPGQETIVVQLGEARFSALVADTPELHAQGLSGRDYMPPEWGMWFDFGSLRRPSFWMRGMLFPIDIIWIDEGLRVVHVTHEAPAPHPDATDSSLPRYNAGEARVRYVLEIGAGLARELDIGLGVTVSIN